jgi:hypothetical protein
VVSPRASAPGPRDVAETGLMGMVAAMSVVLPSIALIQVLANARDYRQPAAAVAAWLAVLGAAAWFVPRQRRGGLAAGETAAAIAVAVAAVTVIGLARQPSTVPGSVDLAVFGTIWLLVLVAVSRPALVWIPGALLVFAVHGALVIRDAGLHSLSLSELAAAGYIMAGVLIAFAALRPAVAVHSRLAVLRASLASRSAAERAAAAAIGQERQARLEVLEREALPLLRGIADGTLDAAAADVRARCARHATLLRDSLAGSEPALGHLVAGLGPALRAARERGLPVTAQLIGDPGTAPPPVARAVLATVDAVLTGLPPQPATLTVLASGDDVELYLTFAGPPPGMPDLTRLAAGLPPAARWHAAVSAGCLEVSWRKEGAR